MIAAIGEDRVRGFQNRAEQSHIGSIAAWKIKRSFGSGKMSKFRFELLPAFGITGQKPRSRGSDSLILFQCSNNRVLQSWIQGKSQIIIRRKMNYDDIRKLTQLSLSS